MDVFGVTVPVWVCLTAALLVLLWVYFGRNYNYWKTQPVISLTRYPLFGAFNLFQKKPFHEKEYIRYKKYGKLYGAYEGSTLTLSVADPDLLRDVLVKDFHVFPSGRDFFTGDPISDKMVNTLRGDDWKRVRTIITPAFTLRKLRIICGILNDCSKSTIENFTSSIEKGNIIDCRGFYDAYAMDVISSSLFGMRLDAYKDPNNEFLKMGRRVFNRGFDWKLNIAFLFPKLAKLVRFQFFQSDVTEYFKRVGVKLINERKEQGTRRNDFLQLMIDSTKDTFVPEEQDEDNFDDILHGEGNAAVFQQDLKNRSLSYDELIAQCVLFLLGGFEAIAGTMSYATYCLASNSECQELLIQEIDEAFEKNEEIDYSTIRDMNYLDCVIKETMRLFPSIFRTERMARQDYKLGDTGIVVPKGAIVTIPVYGMHRDPEFFSEPEKFKPERFSAENKSDINPYTYLPFGAGPRNCLGMRFAMMEMKMCLIYVFRNFRFKVSPETDNPPSIHYSQVLLAPRSLKLHTEVRTDIPVH